MEAPVPIGAPAPQAPAYHTQLAPDPSEPPTTERVTLLGRQMLAAEAEAPVGATELLPDVPTVALQDAVQPLASVTV